MLIEEFFSMKLPFAMLKLVKEGSIVFSSKIVLSLSTLVFVGEHGMQLKDNMVCVSL